MTPPSPKKHTNYLSVAAAAEQSLINSRNIKAITPDLILLARLYCYGFRGQVIGTFHATSQAIEKRQVNADIQEAFATLRALSNISLEHIPKDYRAVLTTFYRYDLLLTRVIKNFHRALTRDPSGDLFKILSLFVTAIERITASTGITIARDDENPPQASFVVPSLGITIVPLVYGEQHSWNLAFLTGQNLNVPRHLHKDGIEIHLGYGPMKGRALLGGSSANVTEGYAMPITPGTPHGFVNDSGHDHMLPFIFGSRRLGGWGVVPDVEPQPTDINELHAVNVLSLEMNGTILLDREIEQTAQLTGTSRRTLISAEQTHTPASGGIVLSASRIGSSPMAFTPERFQIISVSRGRGIVTIGLATQKISAHDHFGIPAGATALITSDPNNPLVLLDAVLVEELPG